MADLIKIINTAHKGYRRAGIQFDAGENHFSVEDISATQLDAIKADPRLTLAEGEPAENDPEGGTQRGMVAPQTPTSVTQGTLAGVVEKDGTIVALADMDEAELRQLAQEMEIDGHDTLSIEALVAAIQAEPVTVPQFDLLVDAIGTLDPSNSEHFTAGGKPQCDALEALMNRPVKAAERDKAWADYQELQEAAE